MKTTHKILFQNSQRLNSISSDSVDLILTSPPYPMIEMWDETFSKQNALIGKALDKGNRLEAFELMHKELDPVWDEIFRVLKNGGFACINIGDATRTINGNFCLYPNHSRILNYFLKLGFITLPNILWRKQTNAPNKFMGSGMLPAGAYVTLEHEYILVVRKTSKREFRKEEEKRERRESAFFWEERNVWFSDVWIDLKGTIQELSDKKIRKRSAAYPFELAYRLINMFSAKEDIVLDPFLGTGTTTSAAMASGRNSIGFEIDPNFRDTIFSKEKSTVHFSNEYIRNRIKKHLRFVENRLQTKGSFKYSNKHYGFPVMTSQEKEIIINELKTIKEIDDNVFEVSYSEKPQAAFCKDWEKELKQYCSETLYNLSPKRKSLYRNRKTEPKQMNLLK